MLNLPVFDKKIIADYNGEGFDSIESEDFEPGQGGVLPERQKRNNIPPAFQQRKLTANEQWNYEEAKRTEAENDRRQDEYLRSKGIL